MVFYKELKGAKREDSPSPVGDKAKLNGAFLGRGGVQGGINMGK